MNKDKIKALKKDYYEKHKKEKKEYDKLFREINKDRIQKTKKEYSLNNQDAIREYQRKYREQNKEKIKEQSKLYYQMKKEKKANMNSMSSYVSED